MDIQKIAVTEFKAGHGTIGTTPTLAGPAYPAVKGVKIKADVGNAGGDNVYVGHSENVAVLNGFQLAAGEEVFIEIDNLEKVWVVGDNPDLGYSYVVI